MPERLRDPNPTRVRARSRRQLVLALWWGSTLVGLFLLSAGAPWILILPVAVAGTLVVANTITMLRRNGPEHDALAPGALAAVDRSRHEGIHVRATRAPSRRAPGRAQRVGTLTYERGTLRFALDPGAPAGGMRAARPRTQPDSLHPDSVHEVIMEGPVTAIRLGPRPTVRRPQLELELDGTTHLLEFTAPGDLATGLVGSVVSAAWYDELRERGARES